MNPGFSERTFEFCFNAEYCQINSGVLATHPHIPSQNQEKELGYDVEFLIRTEEFTTSVFFQHKVPYCAEQRAGRNATFFDAHGGPYFRFGVDRDQHNLLYDLSVSRGNTYYCSPCYNVRAALAEAYRTGTVAQRSLLLDPAMLAGLPTMSGTTSAIARAETSQLFTLSRVASSTVFAVPVSALRG